MDNTRALFVAKQALLLTAASKHAVVYGSCAIDRYIAPCMRFGADGHQDVDVLLPLGSDMEASAEVIYTFFESVKTLLNGLHVTWNVSMNCNGLYCGHVSVQHCHFADVMLVPRCFHDAFEKAFPRNFCSAYLSSFSATVLLRIISMEEAVYRMHCVLQSSKLLDGLPCLPEESNKAMIVKTSRRLERLQVLEGLAMVRREPSPWIFNVDHEFHVLMEKAASVVPTSDAVVTSETEAETKTETETETSDADTQTAIMVTDSAVQTDAPDYGMSNVISAVQAVLASMSGFETTVEQSLRVLDGKLSRLNGLGSTLAMRLDARARRERRVARQSILSAVTIVKDLRIGSYLSATRPIRALQDIMRNIDAEVLSVFDDNNTECAEHDCNLGDYMEKYRELTAMMIKHNRFPFNLIPDHASNTAVCVPGPVTREALVLSGLKMNFMSSFIVFLRCLRASKSIGGDTPLLSPVTPYSEWSDKVMFVTELCKSVEKLRADELKVASHRLLPVVDTITGDVGFMKVANETGPAVITDKLTELTNEFLVPHLDRYNVEFIMHMFDNMIGNITLPIVGHVAQLKAYMKLVQSRTLQIQTMCTAYAKEFAATPCVAQVQKLQVVCESLTTIADSMADGDKVFYSWKGCGGFPKKKSKKKNKKKS